MALKVLLIDDDREFLDALSERLTIREMNVATAASCQAACALVANEGYDVVLLDLQMPRTDGLATIEQLKAIRPNLRIILLTAHATVPKSVQAMKQGVVDVLEKPIDIRVLVERIKTAACHPNDASRESAGANGVLPSLKRFFTTKAKGV